MLLRVPGTARYLQCHFRLLQIWWPSSGGQAEQEALCSIHHKRVPAAYRPFWSVCTSDLMIMLAMQEAMRAAEKKSTEECPVKMKLVAPPLYVLTTNVSSASLQQRVVHEAAV